MMNRKEDQGDRAIEDIKNECKEKGLAVPDITWRGVDLGDFKQTKEVFSALAREESRLDVLVLSSGRSTASPICRRYLTPHLVLLRIRHQRKPVQVRAFASFDSDKSSPSPLLLQAGSFRR